MLRSKSSTQPGTFVQVISENNVVSCRNNVRIDINLNQDNICNFLRDVFALYNNNDSILGTILLTHKARINTVIESLRNFPGHTDLSQAILEKIVKILDSRDSQLEDSGRSGIRYQRIAKRRRTVHPRRPSDILQRKGPVPKRSLL